jgi:hypothetical protein
VQSEVVLFTAVFVLLTLLVNAPMLPAVLRMTKCAGFLRCIACFLKFHCMVQYIHTCPATCMNRHSSSRAKSD